MGIYSDVLEVAASATARRPTRSVCVECLEADLELTLGSIHEHDEATSDHLVGTGNLAAKQPRFVGRCGIDAVCPASRDDDGLEFIGMTKDGIVLASAPSETRSQASVAIVRELDH